MSVLEAAFAQSIRGLSDSAGSKRDGRVLSWCSYGCNNIMCRNGVRENEPCQCDAKCVARGDCCCDFAFICIDYLEYVGRQASQTYGAVDIDTNETAPSGLSEQGCQARCTEDYECSCATYHYPSGKCWKRSNCQPAEWKHVPSSGYGVFMKYYLG
eukprot:TRINITY_DN30546_c0_g2_i1.p1 TRINITY_DN30546_c0_g2~~TRINITY_DN30546_c0_g2_i1.p1  ORF type:complete len:156 (-),score=22.37 TRINITY_DN30546_c0_g2_i1:339-806(-)